jgi:hypothetical protein
MVILNIRTVQDAQFKRGLGMLRTAMLEVDPTIEGMIVVRVRGSRLENQVGESSWVVARGVGRDTGD